MGKRKQVPKVIANLLCDGFDTALFVQDYPTPEMGVSSAEYRADARSLIKATRAADVPAAIVSSLPENIDPETREWLIDNGVAPLQGIKEAMQAIAGGARFALRQRSLKATDSRFFKTKAPATPDQSTVLSEWEGKARLERAGVNVPNRALVNSGDPLPIALPAYPLVAKLVSEALPHKTEAGAVALNLRNENDLAAALESIQQSVFRYNPDIACEKFIVESMVEDVIAELLVGVRRDDQFGLVMIIASGGILVELVDDAQALLLPAHRDDITAAIGQLKVSALIGGFRGKPGGDLEMLGNTIERIAQFAADPDNRLEELDINPLMVTRNNVIAADVLLRIGE